MNNKITKCLFLGFYLITFELFSLVGFVFQLDLFFSEISIKTISASLLVFDLFVVEFLLVLVIGLILINFKYYFRIVAYVIVIIFFVISTVQLMSFVHTGRFLSKLAIENINHFSLIINPTIVIGGIILFVICSALPFCIEIKKIPAISKKSLIIISSITVLSALILYQNKIYISEDTLKCRNDYLMHNNIEHSSPILSLYNTLFSNKIKDESLKEPIVSKPIEKNETGHTIAHEFKKYGFIVNLKNQYPLIKDYIYKGEIPFKRKPDTLRHPNIIIFFTEGLSYRATNLHNNRYPNLTPNIKEFSTDKRCMSLNNYYNHTAATYRGLLGQLCSLYPLHGGEGGWHTNYNDIKKANYLGLHNVLNNYGYETYFFDCHLKDKAYVDDLMIHIGFDNVWTADFFSNEFLSSKKALRSDSLSDNQFYECLTGFLKKNLKKPYTKKPFLICLYNLGTHAFQDISADGVHYKDGSNKILNNIHNLDYAFGKFWNYFKNSAYADNTIIVFTTDHCHFYERPFVETFDMPDYQKFFVDRIPLIIYDPTRDLPETYDANYSTSIDFTPSIIHYLGLSNHKNPFLGTSIFEKNRKEYDEYGIASYGNNFFLVDKNKIHTFKFSNMHQKKLALTANFIIGTYKLEAANKIWDLKLNDEIKKVAKNQF